MAVTSTSHTSAKAIQTYQVCGLQSATRSLRSRSSAEQNVGNRSDTVQFSQEALDRLKLLKQSQEKDVPKETQNLKERDSDLEKNLKILGLNRDASVEEIRKAYLHAVQRYHPDKHASLPPEFRQLAETKTKQINASYSAVLKLKTDQSTTH